MCGIVGYIGHRNSTEILINGLKALEYRGYDSAGIANLQTFNKNKYPLNLKHSTVIKVKMNILNFIRKEHYYVLINQSFQNLINSKIENKKEILKQLSISRETLRRITKNENYWCNFNTVLELCEIINISNIEAFSNIQKIKTKNSFPINLSSIKINKSFMRVIGHILGDGGIHIIKKEGKFRPFYVNNQNTLLESFSEDIKRIFGDVKLYSRKRELHGDEIWLPTTLGHIFYNILDYKKNNNKKKVPGFIFEINDKILIGSFLQVLYDDDGFLYPQKNMIVFSQKNKELIKDIRKLMQILGIKPNQILIHKSKNKTTMHYFSITHKNNIRLFNKYIGFKHPIKKEKLNTLIKKYK